MSSKLFQLQIQVYFQLLLAILTSAQSKYRIDCTDAESMYRFFLRNMKQGYIVFFFFFFFVPSKIDIT